MHINGNIHIGMNILMKVSILINIIAEFWLIAREPMPTHWETLVAILCKSH